MLDLRIYVRIFVLRRREFTGSLCRKFIRRNLIFYHQVLALRPPLGVDFLNPALKSHSLALVNARAMVLRDNSKWFLPFTCFACLLWNFSFFATDETWNLPVHLHNSLIQHEFHGKFIKSLNPYSFNGENEFLLNRNVRCEQLAERSEPNIQSRTLRWFR